jgi:aminopeptidase N
LYLETNKFNSVEVHDLRLAFEKVSGEDLNWFFNQWFLGSGHPDLMISTGYDAANKKAFAELRQVQDFSKTQLFIIPMYIDVYAGGKKSRHKITMTKASERFEFVSDVKPDLINVDSDKMLLCTKSENKPISEWAFQYANAGLYLDRVEALNQLAGKASDSIAAAAIISALSDKYEGVRYNAIGMLKDVRAGGEAEIKTKLVALAKVDGKSIVRAAAMNYLAENFKDEDLIELYRSGLNDKSYMVVGTSLGSLAKVKPEDAISLAKKYENEKSVDVLYAVADVYANHGSDANQEFFETSADKFTGFSKIGYVQLYSVFLKRVKSKEGVVKGAETLARIAKSDGTNKWVAYYAKKSVRDLISMYEDNISFAEGKIKTQKAANPAANTRELEEQVADAQSQIEKIKVIYNGIK